MLEMTLVTRTGTGQGLVPGTKGQTLLLASVGHARVRTHTHAGHTMYPCSQLSLCSVLSAAAWPWRLTVL